ncbi:MAG: Rrf2 family transcriptional regulator [Ruminococcaceae bacterium]|nr:Rrf2 family transcriptional regulator [Oscillospiraceae bacterium]
MVYNKTVPKRCRLKRSEADMRITQEADYALRMVSLLTKSGAVFSYGTVQGTLFAPSMADAVAVPVGFANKILRKLSLAGIVKAMRGVAGGYYLLRDPKELTIKDVIETIDGPIEISKCLSESCDCLNNPNKDCCRFHNVFGVLNQMLVERLDRLTIAMMVDADLSVCDLLETIK